MPAAGKHRVGADRGSLFLRTGRQGLASSAGHDLVIEVTDWSGELVIGDDLTATTVDVYFSTGSLLVREGTGGIKPLSEKDKRDIAQNARKVLRTDSHPRGRFVANAIQVDGNGAAVAGTLTLLGIDRPIELHVTDLGGDHYRVTGQVIQTDYGIKPYTAMLGALRLADAVNIDAELDLSGPPE
jgi:polyisoprenoid-binding protein YceI